MLVLLSACAASSPSAPVTTVGGEAVDAPVPGFVVYGGDTLVVPVRGAPVTLEAMWVLDDRDPAALSLIRWAEEPPPETLHCTCAYDGACSSSGWTRTRFDASLALVDFRAGDEDDAVSCPCYVDPGELPDRSIDEDDPCAAYDTPIEPPSYVSFVGGVLYAFGGVWDNEGCSGVRIVDSYGSTRSLVPGVPPATIAPTRACYEGLFDGDGDARVVLADARCAPGSANAGDAAEEAGEEEDAFDSCSNCAERAGDEAGALYLDRGQLVSVGTNASVFWSLTFVDVAPLTHDNCPGPNDPCGDPSAFAGIDTYDAFWVASDGSAALVGRGGQAWIWPRGSSPVPIDTSVEGVLGVRFHADVRALLGATSIAVPTFEGADVASHCTQPDGTDVATPPLAAEDETFADTHGGRDWGNRCFAHVREGRAADARAACEAGLAIATDPSVVGALLYSLGRARELEGDVGAAIDAYERSLAVRPDNGAVRARLDALR
jgi:hypothetical protein